MPVASSSQGGLMAEREVLRLLQRRGIRDFKEIDREDLLLPRTIDRRARERYYNLLLKYSFRLVLRDIINHQDVFELADLVRYCTLDVAKGYVAFLKDAQVVLPVDEAHYRLAKRPIRSFGTTLEWLIAEVFRREFGADVLWGIRFGGTAHGGDYDVVAAMEDILVYVEIKSSPPKNVEQGEVTSFLQRVRDLLPHMAIFFEDTELRMKDKIVPMFEAEVSAPDPLAGKSGEPVERLERELFHIGHRIFIINAKHDLVINLRQCFRDYLARRLTA